MRFLLVTVFFLEIFGEYNVMSDDFTCENGEEYEVCRSPCEQTCDNIRRGIQSISCSGKCISGCFCRRGLVRADDNTCVPPSECIRPECGENEEFNECGSPCALNCTNLNSPIFCTKPCYRGCFCKPNYVRDSRGKCIEPRYCKLVGNVKCPVNEEYVNCVNFCNTCFISEYCQTPYCTPGCDCKPGYYKNTYGQCITEEECVAEEYAFQQQCGLNEIYTSCVNPCNDCYSKGQCDDYLFSYCTPGCDCKQGFFRNDNGICVPEWNCLRQRQPVCPPGEEYYDCVPTCRSTCDTYSNADVICDTTCNRGCFCKRGFIRKADGLCVSPSECPARRLPCPPGETFYQCLPTCRTTCNTLYSKEFCSTECNQGCFCQPGFVRNDDGLCVPPSECPLACRTNEEFRTCGSACPATCENFREKKVCSQQRCFRGCFCKAGFVLGPRGNCIRSRNCPVRKPIPCCNGLRGRSGNDTDDEDTTLATNITTTPVVTEAPSNAATVQPPESSNSSASSTTKSSSTSAKLPDITTTPVDTEAPSNDSSNASVSLDPRSAASSEKVPAETTTLKPPVPTTSSILAANATTKMSTSTAENKTEPTNLSTNAAETAASDMSEGQSSIPELTTLPELTNSTAVNSTAKP